MTVEALAVFLALGAILGASTMLSRYGARTERRWLCSAVVLAAVALAGQTDALSPRNPTIGERSDEILRDLIQLTRFKNGLRS